MDGALQLALGCILFDPTVVDGAAPADVHARATHAATPRAVVAAEEEKRNYYGPDMPVGFEFYPCGYDTLSGCGKGALAFQRRLAHAVAVRANGGAPPSARLIGLKTTDVRERISVAVMRAAAEAVIKARGKSPHAALIPPGAALPPQDRAARPAVRGRISHLEADSATPL